MREGGRVWVWVGRGLRAERGTHFCEGCMRPGWRGFGGGWGLRSRARVSDGSGRVLLGWGRGGDRRSRGRVLWHVAARLRRSHAAHVLRRIVRGCARRA